MSRGNLLALSQRLRRPGPSSTRVPLHPLLTPPHAPALALSLALSLTLTPPPPATAQHHHAPDAGYTTDKASDRVTVLYGKGGNVGVIATDEGVVVIDTQFRKIAADLIAEIRKVSDQPIRYVINTHVHGDHVGGNPVFQEHADVVAHERTYTRLAEERGGNASPGRGDGLPQVTFERELRLHIAGLDIEVLHPGAGHTDTDVVVWVPSENVVHMGDLFFNRVIPYVDTARGAHTGEWIRSIEAMLARIGPETRVIPGHGRLAGRAELEGMARYLRTVRDRVAKERNAGRTLEEIGALDWTGHDFASWEGIERLPMTIEAAFHELASESQGKEQ